MRENNIGKKEELCKVDKEIKTYKNIVAVSTLGGQNSVAWLTESKLFKKTLPQKRHVNTLVDLIEELTREVKQDWQKVDLIVADIGPASLTGVRVGLATCQGLSMPFNTTIWTRSHLEILAYQAFLARRSRVHSQFPCTYHVAEDARMQQVAYARFTQREITSRLHMHETIVLKSVDSCRESVTTIHKEKSTNIYVGSGWSSYQIKTPEPMLDDANISQQSEYSLAETMVLMARHYAQTSSLDTVEANDLKAIYLRPAV